MVFSRVAPWCICSPLVPCERRAPALRVICVRDQGSTRFDQCLSVFLLVGSGRVGGPRVRARGREPGRHVSVDAFGIAHLRILASTT